NSTISQNQTGIVERSNGITIKSCTIANNGIGLSNGEFAFIPGAYVGDTIFAGNSDGDCRATFTSLGGNLIEDPSQCHITFTTSDDLLGVPAHLGPLAQNGGPTETHALLADSPARDARACTEADTADQRGVVRPEFGACDIGAFEFTCGNGVVDVGET